MLRTAARNRTSYSAPAAPRVSCPLPRVPCPLPRCCLAVASKLPSKSCSPVVSTPVSLKIFYAPWLPRAKRTEDRYSQKVAQTLPTTLYFPPSSSSSLNSTQGQAARPGGTAWLRLRLPPKRGRPELSPIFSFQFWQTNFRQIFHTSFCKKI